MLTCDAPPKVGEILFCVLGQYRFVNLPKDIRVFDGLGADLLVEGRVKLGKPRITERGDLAVPVVSVAEDLPHIAVFVRGVGTEFPANADKGGIHGYTIAGSAMRHMQSMVCVMADEERFLSNWEEIPWEPRWKLGAVTALAKDSRTPVLLGQPLTIVANGQSGGYLPAIVLEGNERSSIGNGGIVLRGLSGIRFKADAATRLYLIDATTGECFHEEIQAGMHVTEQGDLAIRLDNVAGVCAGKHLKVVVASALVELSETLLPGTGCDIGIFGSALGSPLYTTTPLIIGTDATSANSGLANEPMEITGWQAVATAK